MSKKKNRVKFGSPDWDFAGASNDYYNTTGHRKMWNYFLDIFESEKFQNEIIELRKKFNIFVEELCQQDEHILPPKIVASEIYRKVQNEVWELCKRHAIHPFDFSSVIEWYLYYDQFVEINNDFDSCNLFKTVDVLQEKEEPFGKDIQEADDVAFPISIRISPYASQRDLIDYIKKTYPHGIGFLQDQYKNKSISIGKNRSRKKTIRERNDFIYKNRNKSLKAIRQLLASMNIFLDDGHISKIISLEKGRRT